MRTHNFLPTFAARFRVARMPAMVPLAASLMMAACSTLSVPEKAAVQAPPTRAEIAQAVPEAPPKERPGLPGLELDESAFSSLDAATKAALSRISRAFSERDGAFLLNQGEKNYEARVRPTVDADAYLALLYRLGPYATENESMDDKPPRVKAASLSSLRYTGLEWRGPVAELRARVTLTDGTVLPCRVALLWRLSPPRVIGWEP